MVLTCFTYSHLPFLVPKTYQHTLYANYQQLIHILPSTTFQYLDNGLIFGIKSLFWANFSHTQLNQYGGNKHLYRRR